VLADSVCVELVVDNWVEERSVVWETDDVALTLATVEGVSNFDTVSGCNGGSAVSGVLMLWFNDEVIEVDDGVEPVSSGKIIGKSDTAEVAFTVLTDSLCVTVAVNNVGAEGVVVWEIDDVTLTLATVEDVSTLESVSGYNGGTSVTCVLEVWFDNKVVTIEVDPVFGCNGGTAVSGVLMVWFNDEVIEVDDGVEPVSSGKIIGKSDTAEVAFTVLTDSLCVIVAANNVGAVGVVVWEIDDVTLTLATVDIVPTLESVSW